MCPSLFFQLNMRISVVYGTLRVSCKRVVSVLSPLASNSCGGSHLTNGFCKFSFKLSHFQPFLSLWKCLCQLRALPTLIAVSTQTGSGSFPFQDVWFQSPLIFSFSIKLAFSLKQPLPPPSSCCEAFPLLRLTLKRDCLRKAQMVSAMPNQCLLDLEILAR